MIRTYKFPAKLSPSTYRRLDAFLLEIMLIWNMALTHRKDAYKEATGLDEAKRLKDVLDDAMAEEVKEATAENKKAVKKAKKEYWACVKENGGFPTYQDQCKHLANLRQEHAKHGIWSSPAQRSALDRLHKAYQAFIRRLKEGKRNAGFPRYKTENRVRSFETENFTIQRSGKLHAVNVKGVGKFRFQGDRLPDIDKEQYRKLRIVKTAKRIWVMVVCELPDLNISDPRPDLGMDLGVTHLYAFSDGTLAPEETDHKMVANDKEIKKRQRKLSKAQGFRKGETKSNNYKKKQRALAKKKQEEKERRRGKLHELTTWMVNNRTAKWHIEDLLILLMTMAGRSSQKRGLNRAILEMGWGILVAMLIYKAESAGGWVNKVNPRDTSKTCSKCGEVNKHLGRRDPMDCIYCGHEEQRDVNAAKVVRIKGREALVGGASRHARCEVKPAVRGAPASVGVTLAVSA